jgi:hypothetical protein
MKRYCNATVGCFKPPLGLLAKRYVQLYDKKIDSMKSIKLLAVLTIISFCSFGQTKKGPSVENEEIIDSTSMVVISVWEDYGRSLLFVDTKNIKQYKLNLPKPFRLDQHFLNKPGKFRGQKYVMFKASTADGNKDGKIDWGDPTYLYICDTHGQNVKQISPDKLNVKNCVVNPQTNTVTFIATEDTDGNGKYSKDDLDKIFIFNLTSESTTEVKN